MDWLSDLISKFCIKKEENSDVIISRARSFFQRNSISKSKRLRSYSQIAKDDINYSKDLLSLVQSATTHVDNVEIKKLLFTLKAMFPTLESRNSYLILYTSVLAVFFAFSNWAFSLKDLLLFLLAFASLLSLTDRIYF